MLAIVSMLAASASALASRKPRFVPVYDYGDVFVCRDSNYHQGLDPGYLGACGDLHGQSFRGVIWNGFDLRGANLHGTDLSYSVLGKNDLTGADLSSVDLRHAHLTDWDLTRVFDISDSDLSEADLTGADLRTSPPVGVFIGTCVRGPISARGAILDRADLRAASFLASDLSGASLRGARLEGADLSASALFGADLQGALFDASTRLPFSTHEAQLRGMILQTQSTERLK
jgi:uncharacterized protein YjbI with pentapeptide repeats